MARILTRNPRRSWATLLLLATATLAPAHALRAQPPQQTLPALPSRAAAPSQFVPAGWTLEQQKTADLNRDGRPDALLLLRAPQAAEAHGTPSRILAVILRQKKGYVLAESNSRLIPAPGPDQEDPLANGELAAQPGGFSLKLTLMSGAGSYDMVSVGYRFRYQGGCFRLIGYDRMETNRNTLDTHDLSVNFLTGAVIHRTGNAQSAGPPQQTQDSLTSNPRLCLRDLGSAAEFHPK